MDGLVGFLLTVVGLVLDLGKLYWSAFIYPLVAARDTDFVRAAGFTPGADPVDPVVRTVFYLGPVLFRHRLLRARLEPAQSQGASGSRHLDRDGGHSVLGCGAPSAGLVQHPSVVVFVIYTAGLAWLGCSLARTGDLAA